MTGFFVRINAMSFDVVEMRDGQVVRWVTSQPTLEKALEAASSNLGCTLMLSLGVV